MHRKNSLLSLSVLISMATSAQKVKEGIDKAARNPSTKENAAKADVRLMDKTALVDTSLLKTPEPAAADPRKKKKSFRRSIKK